MPEKTFDDNRAEFMLKNLHEFRIVQNFKIK